ncbi:MAG: shikimate kinase [Dehalococcoidia bacterium]
MNLVVIFGPPAVGKATVGKHLADMTGYRLLHNNMALDLVAQFFPRGTPGFELYPSFNTQIIEAAATHGDPDIIFTVAWALDQPADWELMKRRTDAVESRGGQVFYVELAASLGERIRRNALPDRVAAKPRQARELTDEIMKELDAYRLNSGGEFPLRPYLYVNTEHVPADQIASQAVRAWGLSRHD